MGIEGNHSQPWGGPAFGERHSPLSNSREACAVVDTRRDPRIGIYSRGTSTTSSNNPAPGPPTPLTIVEEALGPWYPLYGPIASTPINPTPVPLLTPLSDTV